VRLRGTLNRPEPLLRWRFSFVDTALEQLLSLRPIEVHVEPGAVTPEPGIIELNSDPCECAGQYFRFPPWRADTQGEHHGHAGAPDDQGLRIGRRPDAGGQEYWLIDNLHPFQYRSWHLVRNSLLELAANRRGRPVRQPAQPTTGNLEPGEVIADRAVSGIAGVLAGGPARLTAYTEMSDHTWPSPKLAKRAQKTEATAE